MATHSTTTTAAASTGTRSGSLWDMNRSKVTTDHDEIRRWAEERGGTPAAVKQTARKTGDVGMLRIDFPGYTGAGSLEPISWDDWFKKFDESKLAMILQEETADGHKSNFNKLIGREPAIVGKGGKGGKAPSAARSKSRRATARGEAASAKAPGKAAAKARSTRKAAPAKSSGGRKSAKKSAKK